jgi:ribonuclease P/MRP protein subunit POP5
MRHRKRYIAFRLIGLSNPTPEKRESEKKELAQKLMENLISLFGEIGSTNSGVWVEYFDGKCGIVRCHRDALEKVKIALTLIDEINNQKVLPLIIGVSGTIKRCKIKYLEVCRNANTTDGL